MVPVTQALVCRSVKPGFSRPFRPQGWGALFPRASAFGLSPGLGSPGPLGRWVDRQMRCLSRSLSGNSQVDCFQAPFDESSKLSRHYVDHSNSVREPGGGFPLGSSWSITADLRG